ncbi:MAG: hypothetical protein AAGG56_04080 [Pseudomonadota bacterium]
MPALESWSASEKWAWERICAGEVAEMSSIGGYGPGCFSWLKEGEPEDWPDDRRISADFMKTIATRSPFSEAPAGRVIGIICAVVEGRLDLDDEILPLSLWLHESRLPDGVSLNKTWAKGDLSLFGSDVGYWNLPASGLHVGGDWVLQNGRFPQVDAIGASVHGNVEADGATFTGPLNVDGMEVGDNLFLRGGARFDAGVNLVTAKIGGQIDASGSTFTGLFKTDRMEVGGDLFLNDGARFDADVDLYGATIGGSLQLQGSDYSGRVRLENVRVEGELMLSVWQNHPNWQPSTALGLRNAHVGALQMVPPVPDDPAARHSWARHMEDGGLEPLPVDLANFTYERFGGYGSEAEHDITRIEAARLIAWVEQSVPEGRAPGEGYAPQPYMQLATTLRAMGAEAAADDVDFARLSHRMETRDSPLLWLTDAAARYIVGFGVYPQRALYWFGGLVVAGWLISYRSTGMEGRKPFERLFYSLENALPLIDLSQDFQRIEHPDRRIANFYHFQKVAGFILATVLVGALTLLGG